MAKAIVLKALLALAILLPTVASAGTFGKSKDIDWRIVWHMDENQGNIVRDDSPVTTTSGTAFNSPVWVTDPNTGNIGLDFTNTAGAYIDVTGNQEQPTGAQARTHFYLLKTSTPNGINDRIFLRYGGGAANTLWESNIFNNTNRQWRIANNSNDRTFTDIIIATNVLTCIAETYDGATTQAVYQFSANYAVSQSVTMGGLNTGTNQRFTIGGSELAAVLRSNAQLFDFAIAFQALTRGQIERECNAALNHRSGR